MSIDASTLPIGGAALLTGVGYIAFMTLIGGPEVTDREIARDGWIPSCRAGLAARIEATRAPRQSMPTVPDLCGIVTGGDPSLRRICGYFPDPGDVLWEVERQKRAVEQARIDRALEGVGDACSCAMIVYRKENWLQLALYAGTARVVVPTEVKNRDAALSRALRSPQCRMEG
ncbi:MAG: hypothetical protein AAFN05_14810 [Pseudomonadota bacterium]